mmetsp:Transcript_7780/g.12315  ORF Transcript_7780/g.12315 Transcript_7780/m.12315 type:complete len:351 (-) Transcript_7780:178-1230(-)
MKISTSTSLVLAGLALLIVQCTAFSSSATHSRKGLQMNFLDDLFGASKKASSPPSPMKVAVTGSSGLVGKALCEALAAGGAEVIPVARTGGGGGMFDLSALEGTDAVVHLAGEGVASGEGLLAATGRWSEGKKARILASRVEGTAEVAAAVAGMKRPPKVLVCASAVGYYGYTAGAAELAEGAPRGEGFLAEVCERWEAAARPAAAKTRVVNLRLGVVLAREGGALAKLLPIFSLGAGGNLGSGAQYFSWVSLRDVVRGILFALETKTLAGPANLTAPRPCTNAEFTAALGRALNRPAVVPVPEFAGKIIFGQMGEEMLFGGQRVLPGALTAKGFQFEDTEIGEALVGIV